MKTLCASPTNLSVPPNSVMWLQLLRKQTNIGIHPPTAVIPETRAHFPDLWGQPRLANVTSAWSWRLCWITPGITVNFSVVCTVRVYQVTIYQFAQHCAYTDRVKTMSDMCRCRPPPFADNTTDQKTPMLEGVYLCLAHIAIFRVPRWTQLTMSHLPRIDWRGRLYLWACIPR